MHLVVLTLARYPLATKGIDHSCIHESFGEQFHELSVIIKHYYDDSF